MGQHGIELLITLPQELISIDQILITPRVEALIEIQEQQEPNDELDVCCSAHHFTNLTLSASCQLALSRMSIDLATSMSYSEYHGDG
jgi:hypothetical protein